MAYSTQALKLFKSLYWILLSLAQLYIVYILFTTNRAIAGLLWLIFGFMLIFIMYPVYFPPGDPGSHWPTYIAACPDYLSVLAKGFCVDYVGLNSPLLSKSDPASPPATSDSKYVFDATGSVAERAARAQRYGLSWEGIA